LRESIEVIPTWVPNWSSPLITDPLSYVRAAGYTMPEVQFTQKGALRALGLHVATILSVDVVRLNKQTTRAEVAKELQRIISYVDMEASLMANSGFFETFFRTMCANVFAGRFYPPPQLLPEFQRSIKDLCETLAKGKICSADLEKYFRLVCGHAKGRACLLYAHEMLQVLTAVGGIRSKA
jgi:hypothetical protein